MKFYPEQPQKFNRIHWIMRKTGWKGGVMYWNPGTIVERGEKGINKDCVNISKSYVDSVFREVFGYSSFLNPALDHKIYNKAVIKSEENAVHDGRIVDLPYELEEGEVCQRVIDTWNGTEFVEYRVIIVMGEVAGYIKKTKPNQFNSEDCKMEFLNELLEWYRIEPIKEFCKQIGMDYGELDYLICKNTGAHYIIDANPCPGGVGDSFLNQSHRELKQFIQCHKPLFNEV